VANCYRFSLCRLPAVSVGLSLAIASLTMLSTSRGEVVWAGRTYQFDHPAFSNTQDVISPNVTLTRGSSRGLFNVAHESGFTDNFSPESTLWATEAQNPEANVTATNWQNLTFDDWQTAYGGAGFLGNNILGTNAVLYLELDDIYLDIQFTSWGAGNGSGGEFTYLRAEPPGPGPTGDYNGNQVVDAADYTLWRDTFGQTADPRGSGADGIADGMIDEQDYAFWKLHFGEIVSGGSGGLTATSVPEPASWLLLLDGSMVLARRRMSGGQRGEPSPSCTACA
jgi:hypothetical protein